MPTRRTLICSLGCLTALTGCMGPIERHSASGGNHTEEANSSSEDQPDPEPDDTSAEPEAGEPYIRDFTIDTSDCGHVHDISIDRDFNAGETYLYVHGHLEFVDADGAVQSYTVVEAERNHYELEVVSTETASEGIECQSGIGYQAVVVLPEPEDGSFSLHVTHNGEGQGGFGQDYDDVETHHYLG